ncbi:hypothetical protein JYU34_004425 [Plutella xylostella]|uniref:FLYWCH-type domain-containing protein n=1 Tax=Plutella xylostella TaxID=51655 RepID=A0ABQ7QXZ6_PLUXY|nr:hypothetical protein JYU34_004425 [Plutella xylostella]
MFVATNRGQRAIQLGRYRFTRGRCTGSKTVWRCVKQTTAGCKAMITTVENAIVKLTGEHTH